MNLKVFQHAETRLLVKLEVIIDENETPIEKNEYYDVTFEDLTHEGAGVAKVQGFLIFVPNALPEKKRKSK